MRDGFFVFVLLLFAWGIPAQAQQAGLPDRQAGLPDRQAGIAPDWEVRRMVEEANRRVGLLAHAVDQVHEDGWPTAASSARESVRSLREQLSALQRNLADLKEEPDRLSVLLEAIVRLDTIVRQADALRPAVARYQDPGLAIDLDRLIAAPSASRETLFSHASDLARFVDDQLRSLRQDLAHCEQTPREREARPNVRRSQKP